MILLFFISFINCGWLAENMQVTMCSSTMFKNVFEGNMLGMFLYIIFFHIFGTDPNIVPQWHNTGFSFWSPSRQTKGICGKKSGRSWSWCLQWVRVQDEAPLGGRALSVGLVVLLQRGCPDSSIDMLAHRHYFQKGFQHRQTTGGAIQGPWQSCTWDGFSDSFAIFMELLCSSCLFCSCPSTDNQDKPFNSEAELDSSHVCGALD